MMLFNRLFPAIGSFASLLSLILIQVPQLWHNVILLFAVGFLVWIVVLIVRDYRRTRPHIMPVGPEIQKYMYSWINQGGRVAILSRDMSWADDEKIIDLLMQKAQNGELCICLPRHIPVTESLENLGANIHIFPELDFVPESRFTIINKDRTDSQLAFGRSDKGKHRIEEYSSNDHCALWIANDFIDFITKFDKNQKAQGLR